MAAVFQDLDFNTSILLKELQQRKVKLHRVEETLVVKASTSQKSELLFDITSSAGAFTSSWIASDKFYTKQFLQLKGFPVPEGKVFAAGLIDEALDYAETLGYPVVAKPVADSHGEFVYALLESAEELKPKLHTLSFEYQGTPYFIIEKHVPGNEYRLFVTREGFFAAVHRSPAKVVGDGHHSLMQLIQIENYRRLNPRTTSLSDIKLDDMVFDYLEKKGLTIESVPAKDEVVQLRATSNVSKGGNCYGITDQVHPSIKKFAFDVLASVQGLPFVGIDLLCERIDKPLNSQPHWICELNASPGLSLHTLPESGESQDTPAAVADVIFGGAQ